MSVGSLLQDVRYTILDLQSTLEQYDVQVDSAGTRVITTRDSSHVESLDGITQLVLDAAEWRCDQDDLTIPERVAGMNIVQKLKQWYIASDAVAPQKTFSPARRSLESGPSFFRAFSEKRLEGIFCQLIFKEGKDAIQSHCDAYLMRPERWSLREEILRALYIEPGP